MARKRMTDEHRKLMATLYTKGLLSCQDIANRLGCSRQTVVTSLRKRGLDTSRRKMVVECSACGELTPKTRAEVRKHERHFCSPACYAAYLRRPSTSEENFRMKKIRDKYMSILPYGGNTPVGIHVEEDGTVFLFPDREAMLEWKRTGLPASAFVTATMDHAKVVYKGGK